MDNKLASSRKRSLRALDSLNFFLAEVKYAGYDAAFLTMAAIAGVALLFFWFAMPETKASLGQKTGEVGEQQA